MGKRKSAKKPQTKKSNEPLSTEFKCLFCNYEKAVGVRLDKQKMFGNLFCKMCGQKFTCPINHLSAAVDVYCDWVDACEEVRLQQPAKKSQPSRGPSPRAPSSKDRPRSKRDADDDDEDEDDDRDTRRKESKRRDRDDDEDEEEEAVDDEDDDEDDDRGKRRRVVDDYDDDDE